LIDTEKERIEEKKNRRERERKDRQTTGVDVIHQFFSKKKKEGKGGRERQIVNNVMFRETRDTE